MAHTRWRGHKAGQYPDNFDWLVERQDANGEWQDGGCFGSEESAQSHIDDLVNTHHMDRAKLRIYRLRNTGK